jgi:broad specificity phosphatase PhoE
LLAVPAAEGKPAQVFLIRHAEKPTEGDDLSQRGRERAAALVPYFLGRPEVLQFGPPVAVYAQKSTANRPSRRPVQTVQGLADALKVPVLTYSHSDAARMADEILTKPAYEGKAVVVCWEHHAIPDLARALGARDAPARWRGEAFDRTWVLTFARDGAVTVRDLPQKLLFIDDAE